MAFFFLRQHCVKTIGITPKIYAWIYMIFTLALHSFQIRCVRNHHIIIFREELYSFDSHCNVYSVAISSKYNSTADWQSYDCWFGRLVAYPQPFSDILSFWIIITVSQKCFLFFSTIINKICIYWIVYRFIDIHFPLTTTVLWSSCVKTLHRTITFLKR